MLGALLAGAVTLILAPVVLGGLRARQVLDVPNPRSSHDRPTPRGGGLAPAAGALVALGVTAGVTGAAAAFLPFNFPRARMFLGDVGSYFFGAWLAVLAVVGLRQGLTIEAAFAPLAVYVADTGSTLARRILRHQAWYRPHRDHTYQRLTARGVSHTAVAALVAVVIAACSALGAVSLVAPLGLRVLADAALALLLAIYLASPRT